MQLRIWLAEAGGGHQAQTLDPGQTVTSVHGVRGTGLLLFGRDGDVGVLSCVDFTPEDWAIQELVRVPGLQSVSAIDCNRNEAAIYLVDSKDARVLRIPVLAYAPLALGGGSPSGSERILSANIPAARELTAAMRFLTSELGEDALECASGGFLDAQANDGVKADWLHWRVARVQDEIVVRRITKIERRYPWETSWQLEELADGLQFRGRLPGQLYLHDRSQIRALVRWDYDVAESVVVVPFRAHKELLGRWVYASGGSLADSRAVFATIQSGADRGWESCSWQQEYRSGLQLVPGGPAFPIVVQRREGAFEEGPAAKLVLVGEWVRAEPFWSDELSWPEFGPMATVVEVDWPRDGVDALVCGVKLPAAARPGDLCKWQFLRLEARDGGWSAAAVSRVSVAAIHSAPARAGGYQHAVEHVLDLGMPTPQRVESLRDVLAR